MENDGAPNVLTIVKLILAAVLIYFGNTQNFFSPKSNHVSSSVKEKRKGSLRGESL